MRIKSKNPLNHLAKLELEWLRLSQLERDIYERFSSVEGVEAFESFCAYKRAVRAGLVKNI